MSTNSKQPLSPEVQQHHIALEFAASETCRRSPNLHRHETGLLVAKLHAARSADEFMLPQTIYRSPDSSGWWHTNSLAPLLAKAEVFATILTARYFH